MSEYIGRMPFLWLAIDDEPSRDSLRAYVERNAIALLSGGVERDPASPGWLGRFAADEAIRRSGLWNVRHVGEPYAPEFLDVLDELVATRLDLRPVVDAPRVQSRALGAQREEGDRRERTIALVSCTKRKADSPCCAADLYRPSTFFRLANAYAHRVASATFILSAKYGLLRPDDVVAPYEQTLNDESRQERRSWAERVYAQLLLAPEYQRATAVVWLAGLHYRAEVLPRVRADGKRCVVPMEGLRQREQLAWLAAQSDAGAQKVPAADRATRPTIQEPSRPRREIGAPATAAPSAADFARELDDVLERARAEGKGDVLVAAGQLHRAVGGYSGPNHRMPVCCRVMRQRMRAGDEILAEPPSGQGASLQIRYRVANSSENGSCRTTS